MNVLEMERENKRSRAERGVGDRDIVGENVREREKERERTATVRA